MSTTITHEGAIFYDAQQHAIAEAPHLRRLSYLKPPSSVPRISNSYALLWMDLRRHYTEDVCTYHPVRTYARLPTGSMLKKAFRSRHPTLNVYRRNEDGACDIVYSDFPTIFDGSTAAVICFGTYSKVTDINGNKCDNQFAKTLEDTIIQ
jgi:hypothetical protein